LGVREEHPTDRSQIGALLNAVFARPDETSVLEGARAKGDVVLSLVAEFDSQIIGHISFVRIAASIDGKTVKAVTLTHLAVEPSRQDRGIGSVLVGAGLEAARTAGFDAVFVTSELAYFARFGFSSQIATAFESAGSTPLAGVELTSGVLAGASGTLGDIGA
jgi:putative acetyltransferase